jgi:DNA (cytosine-5)-methyltransferase 1
VIEGIVSRPNIRLSKAADALRAEDGSIYGDGAVLRGVLAGRRDKIRVVDLFAGAGGFSTGFVATKSHDVKYKLVCAAEYNPAYNRTLNANHSYLSAALGETWEKDFEPIDLLTRRGRDYVADAVRRARGVDLLIGGPPCQGFSQANRNSWSPENPNNKLVDIFMRFALEHHPKAILMENVQGIMWTARSSKGKRSSTPAAAYISERLSNAGYNIYTTILDAVWYGVPQHRNRFFLLAIRNDLGYGPESFGEWGPFPRPTHGPGLSRNYVTVREAIADLPRIANGESRNRQRYAAPIMNGNAFLRTMRRFAPKDFIEGHIVTNQADYVIERYKRVPPGGNWQDIRRMLRHYSRIENTHSNIYRRLMWDSPAVTIGHYRKSMLIHPSQNRGLSLREACRLQALPDWFVLHGSPAGSTIDSLDGKQQQLANAVSYAMTASVAQFLIDL